MGIRTRRRLSDDSGFRQDFPWESGYVVKYGVSDETCTDTSPSPGGNFFSVERWTASGSRVSGGPDHRGYYIHQNIPSSALQSRLFPYFVPEYSTRPSNSELASRMLANTNPSKPAVDVPAFVAELREMPQLLRKEIGNIAQKAGSTNLKYWFGVKPVVDDLFTLLTFTDLVNKRVNTLRKLQKRGLAYTQSLWSDSAGMQGNLYGYQVSQTNTTKVSGHVKWTLTEELPQDSSAMQSLAIRAVLGLRSSSSTLWELMPWSWLIDYCTNIGDILTAKRNIISASPSVVEIMTHSITEASHDPFNYYGSPYYICTAGLFKEESKRRQLYSGFVPSASLPFLNPGQWSILASIGVTRRFKGR